MTVAGRLVAALEASALGVPVLPPGSATPALPAVVVVPATSTTAASWIDYAYDVTVMVPRDAAVEQLDRLETLTDTVFAALVAAGWTLGTTIRYVGGDGDDVHYMARVITASGNGAVIC